MLAAKWCRVPRLATCFPARSRRPQHASPARRRRVCAAAEPDSTQAQAKVLEQVEASASLIDEMVGEIARELFLDAAVSHITDGEQPGPSPATVVTQVVRQRLEQLDSTFLATLDSYIQGASDKGAADVAEVLLMVRDEVLRRLGEQMPPEMRLLDAALLAADSEARATLLRRHALLSGDVVPEPGGKESSSAGGSASGADPTGSSTEPVGAAEAAPPHCQAADLERAATQLISDMELLPQVPDRRLLAKLVLVREEVQQMLVEHSFQCSMTAGIQDSAEEATSAQLPFRQLGAVPRSCAVFLQRLMALGSPDERRALLEYALQADRERLPDVRGQDEPPPTNFERLRAESERPQDWVRPGRFMQSLNALQQEMLQPSLEAQPLGVDAAAAPSPAVLERLESIRREALGVLLDIAGEGQPYLP